jgi:apolipoprotein N-acyltransferase
MTLQSNKPGIFGILTEFRKWIVLLLLALVLFFGYKYFSSKGDTSVVEYDTALIQQQIKNVGKLVVTEGHFAEVITYKDSKKYLGNFISFEKKAIVVINADVSVSFDLSKMKYEIDSINKVITVVEIPNEEIKIAPDFKYYNTESSTFNEFTGEDYNKINKIARANLAKKIQASTLKTNAKNRLLSELNSLFIVTKNLGWTMKYKDEVISSDKEVKQKFLN